MKKIIVLCIVFMLLGAHNMYLKMHSYFLQPNTASTIQLFNGTFEKSDNIIDRNRMVNVSLVGNGTTISVDTSQWTEQEEVTILNFTSGEEGTWVAGVSTHPRNIELEAKAFNEYLEHDGVLDMLEWRKEHQQMDEKAIEKYSKHVKTVFQVGHTKTKDWQTVLGYPIEFVPVSNPYEAKIGDDLQVKLLWQGQPLPNQLVYVCNQSKGHSHDHDAESENDHSHDHTHDELTQLRSNEQGIVSVKLTHEGEWYLRTIHMEHAKEADLTHESNWATLTFEVRKAHSHGFPTYAYLIVGIVLLGGLVYWLNRK